MRVRTVETLGLVLFAVGTLAQTAPPPAESNRSRPPSSWRAEERVAARFDPVSVRERNAARPSSRANLPDAVFVDGSKNPEMLMPWEVLTQFLHVLELPPERQAEVRAGYRRHIESAGWSDDEFWQTVESAAASYLVAKGEARSERADAAREASSKRICAERARTLDALRTRLGAAQFDAFLYATVAPGMKIVTRREIDAERLLFIERGCR